MDTVGIIERLEQIDELCTEIGVSDASHHIEQQISDIEGIVGEILTMLDGR